MGRLSLAVLTLTLFAAFSTYSQVQVRKFAFSDEFNGPANSPVDSTKWTLETGGWGWGNQELEYYNNTTANAYQNGSGSLVIKAVKLDPPLTLTCWYGPCEYTSARMITKQKFEGKYGRIEARIKIPRGQGIWPAFWMLGNDIDTAGWPACGEIDIMENIGREPGIVHGTIHGPGYSGGNGIGGQFTLPVGGAFADDFHVYAIEWSATKITWYVDGFAYRTTTTSNIPGGTQWVFDHPFFIILNVAVGGGWPGNPDGTTVFPQEMRVDYVRVEHRQG